MSKLKLKAFKSTPSKFLNKKAPGGKVGATKSILKKA